jgi:hypothetical protein
VAKGKGSVPGAGGRKPAGQGSLRREDVATWLEGPPRPAAEPGSYPGQRLGLPEQGPGAIAPFGRRLGAIVVDWLACVVIASAFSGNRWLPLGVFAAENVLLLCTLGSTFGMRLFGLRVVALGDRRALLVPWRALVRTVLLCVLVPAVIWDRDGRGLHDKWAGTAVVRAR